MRLVLTFCSVALLAAPAMTMTTTAEAQVLAGRNSARSATRPPRLTTEQRLNNRLAEAEDRLAEIDDQIARIEDEVDAAGSRTPSQERELAALTRRREREAGEIARLNEALEALPQD
jgi:septal ring factor EnvC (AmiA/AmiB activator)